MQTFTPKGTDDPFANRIRLWAARRGFQHSHTELANGFIQVRGKDAVAIMEQVFIATLESDGISQLLQCPGSARMCGDIVRNDTAAMVLDHDEHVQQSECRRDHNKQVAGNDSLGVQA